MAMRSIFFAISLCVCVAGAAQEHHHHVSHEDTRAASTAEIADVGVRAHDGRALHFYRDLVKGRVTVLNFIFTSCTTVCPLMGVRFAQLQPLLPDDVSLISVSIDPVNDTPARLEAWSRRVGAKPGWTLVTGTRPDIDTLLRSLGTTVADPASHTPLVIIVDDRGATPSLRRVDGLTGPETLASLVKTTLSSATPAEAPSAKYFANVGLVDQDGKPVDLYSLMKDRTIVINTFFASCTDSCVVMTGTLNAIQTRFADRVGKDLVLVSISVDPKNDTPAKLKTYAKATKAIAGRYFLTGSKEQVETALRRIGQYAASPEQHTNVMIVGNEKTGLWKKAFGLARPEAIVEIVRSVLDDAGELPGS